MAEQVFRKGSAAVIAEEVREAFHRLGIVGQRMGLLVRDHLQARQQFLYSRAITTYFDLQGGLRSDIDSRPTRNWAAFGIQGLAPYFFDLELTGFVSSQGHLAATAFVKRFMGSVKHV